MQINAYTEEGLKEVLKFNNLDANMINWNMPIYECYWRVVMEVQKKGRYKNLTISAREGFHRTAASVLQSLACCLDIDTGHIIGNELKEEDVTLSLNIDNVFNHDNFKFRDKIYNSTFNNQHSKTQSIMVSCRYFIKDNLNGCEASYHLRTASLRESLDKKESVTKSVFVTIGRFLNKCMEEISQPSATLRLDFDQDNPTTKAIKKKDVEQALNDAYGLIEDAFPMGTKLNSDEYKNYMKDPLNQENMNRVKNLFKFDAFQGDYYHVPSDSKSVLEMKQLLKENQDLYKGIQFPFLPSVASNGIDVGDIFGHKNQIKDNKDKAISRFNPDTANNAIMAPWILVHLYAAYHNISLAEAVASQQRKDLTEYWIRCHNHHGDCCHDPSIHWCFQLHYNQTLSQKDISLFSLNSCILGTLHFIVNSFNAYLSIRAEERASESWNARQKHFKIIAKRFGEAFSIIGNTRAGRDVTSVIKTLCKIIMLIQFFYVTYFYQLTIISILQFSNNATYRYLLHQISLR